jgi:hypothetical protein
LQRIRHRPHFAVIYSQEILSTQQISVIIENQENSNKIMSIKSMTPRRQNKGVFCAVDNRGIASNRGRWTAGRWLCAVSPVRAAKNMRVVGYTRRRF